MLRALLSTLLLFVVLILIVVVAAAVIAALVLGLAWVLTLVFPIRLVEAALVILGVAGGIIFYAGLNMAATTLADAWREGSELADTDWWEEEEEEEEEPAPTAFRPIPLPTVSGRTARTGDQIKPDDLCPCGSGRKYKNCCGKKRR